MELLKKSELKTIICPYCKKECFEVKAEKPVIEGILSKPKKYKKYHRLTELELKSLHELYSLGLSIAEISRKLNLTYGTTFKHINAIRKSL